MPSSLLNLTFWQRLLDWDTRLFLTLNHKLANPLFDTLLPFFRDSIFWAPLYLLILAFVYLNFGTRGLWWSLFFILTVAISDLTGTYLFKETVRRIRPCNEPSLAGQVRLMINACPGGYSFLSNHAANHFGLATFMVFSFRSTFKVWIYLFYVWAILICFAQLYVGVHYPSDILAGMLLGTMAGYTTASVYRYTFGKLVSDT
jgi:undecaprenyl-diphosphatase